LEEYIIYKKDIIYIAGKLSAPEATEYIKNAHNIIKLANQIQKKFNCGVYSPANDFLQGIVSGQMNYDDYFNNTQEWLKRSSGMYLVPEWKNSSGVQKEIEYAKQCNIPIFENWFELEDFLNRPIIITICGKSGSGKSEIAHYIKEKFKIPQIQSYTDRPKRSSNEKGHIFISPEEFDTIKKDDMIAWTNFGGNRYCATKQQVYTKINTYIIDERGLVELQSKHKNDYRIVSLFIERKDINVDEKRKARDESNFFLDTSEYAYVLSNNDTFLTVFFETLDMIIKDILRYLEVDI